MPEIMTTSQYRCVAAHLIYWKRGLKEAIEDAGLSYTNKDIIIDELFAAGYAYDEDKDSLVWPEDEKPVETMASIVKPSSSMSYEELANKIAGLTDEQKKQDVTILVGDEYLPMNSFAEAEHTDVLDVGHPYLFFY